MAGETQAGASGGGYPAGKLAGRVALVTGGGGGIGAALCRAFAREGARVAVADIVLASARQVADAILAEADAAGAAADADGGEPAAAWAFDVADRQAVEDAAAEVAARLGPPDIWVNNAGISCVMPFLECSDRDWDEVLRINLRGAFVGCQVALRSMVVRRRGVILNMSSQSGKVGASQYAAYCASKFAIIGLTQSLALEFAGQGIRVNALCPGIVFTALWEGQLADYARKRDLAVAEVRPYLESRIPLGRLCTPEDVARAAVYLASDDAAYITGQALNLTGGSIMH